MARFTNLFDDLVNRITNIGGNLLKEKSGDHDLATLCQDLLGNPGEATGLARSRDILARYTQLSEDEKSGFFSMIFERFGTDIESLNRALTSWQESPSLENARKIHFSSEPKTQELIRRLNLAPGGTATLVLMRTDLLRIMRNKPELKPLDDDFRHLFSSWFNRGFLRLESISWATGADVLEKIIKYEAVHQIDGWNDLRNRVGATDRRLYAFFHPALNSDPLIFVEVALVKDLPESIHEILLDNREQAEPAQASTAIFYSISNCQSGLRGISFGSFLIKQVAEQLKAEIPSLSRFMTLSPMPTFRHWASNHESLSPDELALVEELNSMQTPPSQEFQEYASPALNKLAARYLVEAKKRGGPFDPVSRFHLGNGAHLEQIRLWADLSENGLKNSWGVMVNYEYRLDEIEKNHEAFSSENKIIYSNQIRQIL